MKKKIYQISTILILIILLIGIHSQSFATIQQITHQKNLSSIRVAAVPESAGGGVGSSGDFTPDKIMQDADNFLEQGSKQGNKFDEESTKYMIKSIYNVLLIIGTVVVVIVGIILGIKFITGSIEEQAKVKEMLIPYTVGSVVIFSAFAIWKLVVDLLQSAQAG